MRAHRECEGYGGTGASFQAALAWGMMELKQCDAEGWTLSPKKGQVGDMWIQGPHMDSPP